MRHARRRRSYVETGQFLMRSTSVTGSAELDFWNCTASDMRDGFTPSTAVASTTARHLLEWRSGYQYGEALRGPDFTGGEATAARVRPADA
jgi:hypothetical protein